MKRILTFLIILGIWVLITSCGANNIPKDPFLKAGFRKFKEKIIAPALNLKDIDGNLLRLKDLQDKNVLLDFWATW